MTSVGGPESRGIRLWIASLCVLVFAMVIVGGITRLTRSGLSIVEWRPVTGILPPIGEADWQEQFDAYKQFPEYRQVNHQMSLDEFKGIFFWEYFHRLLGRIVGLALIVPLTVLAIRKRLTKSLVQKLAVVFVLGGLQGVIGWYMVKSGLVNMPRVSHYRLATHLSMAFFLFSLLFWIFLGLGSKSVAQQSVSKTTRELAKFSVVITALLALQIVYGAFVAGMRAGYGFNTFPLMNGQVIPEGFAALTPLWLNLVENPATVQFIHRAIAFTLAAAIVLFWWRVRQSGDASPEHRRAASLLVWAVAGQFTLGVSTLLLAVPVSLAVLHQAGAFVLLGAAVYTNFVYIGRSQGEAQGRLDAVA